MYELNVEKMSCGHCVRAVTEAVQALDAAARVEVDLAAKKVRVHTAAPLPQVTAAIADAGYPVVGAS
jgi:copper chaperone